MRHIRAHWGPVVLGVFALGFISWTMQLMYTGKALQEQAGQNVRILLQLSSLDSLLNNVATNPKPFESRLEQVRTQTAERDYLDSLNFALDDAGLQLLDLVQVRDQQALALAKAEVRCNTIIQGMTAALRSENSKISMSLKAQWSRVNLLAVLASVIAIFASALFWFFQQRNTENKLLREEAEQASRAKSKFLSAVSHELRTPLNAIIGMTDLSMQKSKSQEIKDNLDVVKASANTLLSLVNDILDLSKIEAGKLSYEHIEFNFRETLTQIAQAFEGTIRTKGLSWNLKVSDAVPNWALGDPLRIRQVLLNLVSNAVKFTDDGYIELRVELTELATGEQAVRLEVEDCGVGVPIEMRDRIFERFQQVEQSGDYQNAGTGLGLAISRSLVEGMGGTIGLRMRPQGGSIFYFTLPLEWIPAPVDNTGNEETLSKAKDDLGGIQVLVAEDNPMNQLVIEQLLKNWNAQVDLVDNGVEAITSLNEKSYSLLLLDLQMPELDGFETIKKIREQESLGGKRLPVIALTANAFEQTRIQVMESGMDGFVSKPFDQQELYQTIKRLVEDQP